PPSLYFLTPPPPPSTLFPYTTLFRSGRMSILPPELRLHLLIEVGPDWPREGVLHQGHHGARHVHSLGVQPHRRLPQVAQQRDEEPHRDPRDHAGPAARAEAGAPPRIHP